MGKNIKTVLLLFVRIHFHGLYLVDFEVNAANLPGDSRIATVDRTSDHVTLIDAIRASHASSQIRVRSNLDSTLTRLSAWRSVLASFQSAERSDEST